MFLKHIVAFKAHVAEHRTSQHKFEETLTIFTANAFCTTLAGILHPTEKTLYERFKKMVAHHRASTRRAESCSGVAEIVSERMQLLEDIVL